MYPTFSLHSENQEQWELSNYFIDSHDIQIELYRSQTHLNTVYDFITCFLQPSHNRSTFSLSERESELEREKEIDGKKNRAKKPNANNEKWKKKETIHQHLHETKRKWIRYREINIILVNGLESTGTQIEHAAVL